MQVPRSSKASCRALLLLTWTWVAHWDSGTTLSCRKWATSAPVLVPAHSPLIYGLVYTSRGPWAKVQVPKAPGIYSRPATCPPSAAGALSWHLSCPLPSFSQLPLLCCLWMLPAAGLLALHSLSLDHTGYPRTLPELLPNPVKPSTLEPKLLSMSYVPGSQLMEKTMWEDPNLHNILTTPQPPNAVLLPPNLKPQMIHLFSVGSDSTYSSCKTRSLSCFSHFTGVSGNVFTEVVATPATWVSLSCSHLPRPQGARYFLWPEHMLCLEFHLVHSTALPF